MLPLELEIPKEETSGCVISDTVTVRVVEFVFPAGSVAVYVYSTTETQFVIPDQTPDVSVTGVVYDAKLTVSSDPVEGYAKFVATLENTKE